jgi:hypothetical protein
MFWREASVSARFSPFDSLVALYSTVLVRSTEDAQQERLAGFFASVSVWTAIRHELCRLCTTSTKQGAIASFIPPYNYKYLYLYVVQITDVSI